jgi:RHS repeat-associated protein
MPGRNYSSGTSYRYGFNGKENDKEGPVQYDYGFRIYDPRLMRFKSVDPLTKSYPWYTPYQFAGNSPICFIDMDGGEPTSPPEYLKNVRLVYDLNKGNIIQDVYFDPKDRMHKMDVEKIYDGIKKQAFFVYHEGDNNYFWNSSENTLRVKRNANGTSTANGTWEKYDSYEQRQKKIRADVPNLILGFLGGGAAVAVAAPVIIPYAIGAAPTIGASFTMTAGERGVSAGADALIQYSQNIPEQGFGLKNLSNINISSIMASGASGVPIVSNALGNGLEINFSEGYKGIGSSKADYSSMGLNIIIGTIGGKGGNAIDKALGKYVNAGKLWNKGASDLISGSVSGAAQKIAQMSKNNSDEKK